VEAPGQFFPFYLGVREPPRRWQPVARAPDARGVDAGGPRPAGPLLPAFDGDRKGCAGVDGRSGHRRLTPAPVCSPRAPVSSPPLGHLQGSLAVGGSKPPPLQGGRLANAIPLWSRKTPKEPLTFAGQSINLELPCRLHWALLAIAPLRRLGGQRAGNRVPPGHGSASMSGGLTCQGTGTWCRTLVRSLSFTRGRGNGLRRGRRYDSFA
jgi:hypothetical protein